MKVQYLLLGLLCTLFFSATGQTGIDVAKLTADTKTFIFDDNKNTVKNFIYQELNEKTTCCGSDRIYLEVKIDPSGYVLQVKTLTGKNECFKQSAVDIVKNVKWDASSFKGPKPIYFEIKPEVECEGSRDNVYAMVPITNNQLLDQTGALTSATQRGNPPTTTEQPSSSEPQNVVSSTETAPTERTAPNEAEQVPNTSEAVEEVAAKTSKNPSNEVVAESNTLTIEPKTEVKDNTEEVPTSGTNTTIVQEPSAPTTDASVAGKSDAEPTREVAAPVVKEKVEEPVVAAEETKVVESPINQTTPAEQPSESKAENTNNQRLTAEAVDTEPSATPVNENELQLLKEEMAELRRKEEEEKEKMRKREAYLERRRQYIAEKRRQRQEAASQSATADGEDTIEEDPFAEDFSGSDDPFVDGESGGDDGGGALDRIAELRRQQEEIQQQTRDRIAQYEEERRRLEETQRQIEAERREAIARQESLARERLRVEEEIRRTEEDNRQRQEELELEQIEVNRQQVEQSRLEQERLAEQLQAEVETLQRQQERLLEELRRQEEELARIQQDKIQREQEIALGRLERQKQIEAEIKLLELQVQTDLAQASGGASSVPGNPEISNASGLGQAITADSDSERLNILIREISLLQEEIKRMQLNMLNSQQSNPGGASVLPSRPGSNSPSLIRGSSAVTSSVETDEDTKNAGADNSWKGINYRDPDVPTSEYRTVPEPPVKVNESKDNTTMVNQSSEANSSGEVEAEAEEEVSEFDPVRGYSPSGKHKETHANVVGPQFSMPKYGAGEEAMKDFIKDNLRDAGICGLVQAFAEVNVDQNGRVISQKVLKANNPSVMIRLPGVLQQLTFDATESNIPRPPLYIEFKTDILCSQDDSSEVDLKEVESYIKENE